MTSSAGEKEQVPAPEAIRDHLGIAPRGEVVVGEAGGAVGIRRPRGVDLLGLLGAGVGVDDLAAERRREREREV